MSAVQHLAAAARPGTTRWAALGDSFTCGTGEEERAWPELLLESYDRPLDLQLLARAGATAADVESEQLPCALAQGPDLVTLVCGGNDVIRSVRPELAGFAACYDGMLHALRQGLPRAVLVTATYPAVAPPMLRPRTRGRIERGLAELNRSIRESADRHGVHCIELHRHPGRADRGNYATDGLHPSDTGHLRAAETFRQALEELLPQPATSTHWRSHER